MSDFVDLLEIALNAIWLMFDLFVVGTLCALFCVFARHLVEAFDRWLGERMGSRDGRKEW